MLEYVPEQVDAALLYFHSAGTSSDELAPFLPQLIEDLPNTYIWAGDGVVGGTPLMRQGTRYAHDTKRYWFTFPMQDASAQESFAVHAEAMGASLTCAGAYINAMADAVMTRFGLSARQVVFCGFQHGSSVVLSATMMRTHDPYRVVVLFEPYLLEAYYLKDESPLPSTIVLCIDNEHIRQRTLNWLNEDTVEVFESYGIKTQRITVEGGDDKLDERMVGAAIQAVQNIVSKFGEPDS